MLFLRTYNLSISRQAVLYSQHEARHEKRNLLKDWRREMTVKNRIRALQLSQMIEKKTEYANALGVSVIYLADSDNNKESNADGQQYAKGEYRSE